MQSLQVVEVKGQRVLTAKQIAEAYRVDVQKIQQNFANNRSRFVDGKHYISMKGNDLRDFKNKFEKIELVGGRTRHLYLWTEKGALLHAKSLNTEKAWEVYDYLVDFYFRAKEETQETAKRQQAAEKNAVVPVKTRTERIPESIEMKERTIPLYNSMNAGKVFENLIHLAASEGLMVKFAPLRANYARIKGDRIALNSSLATIEDFNYNLAQSLAHYFLHYDKGDITEGSRYKEYEEQADRGAKMLMTAMTAK